MSEKQVLFIRIFKDGKLLDVKQFDGPQIVMGREGEVDLAIHDSEISPIHAMIEEREPGKYFLCDLGGPSGIILNGQKIVDAQIESGVTFQIGSHTIEFNVGIPKPKKAAGPTHAPAPITQKTPPPPPPLVEPAAIPKAVPKPPKAEARSSHGSLHGMNIEKPRRTRAAKGTYAPDSKIDVNTEFKPGRGNVVEVVLSWQGRVINTYHFNNKETVHIGAHPKNNIILPVFGSVRISHPLLEVRDSDVVVYLTPDMTGDVVRERAHAVKFEDLKRQGQMLAAGTGFAYALQQSEAIRIHFGEGVELLIRYVGLPPGARLIPFMDLSVNQLTGLVVGFLGTALFLFYAYIYAPNTPDIEQEKEPERKAVFAYKPRVELSETTEAPKPTQEPKKGKVVAPEEGVEGAAQEAAPNKSQSKERKLTTPKAGKDKGIQKAPGKAVSDSAPKAPPKKDVNKVGLLGVFGTNGVQDQINKANTGAGNVAGLSQSATGAGAEAAGAGNQPGSGMREVGMGGKGTATVGIAGIKTAGKGGGVSGYGNAGLGAKKNATLISGGEGESFSGSIDREAIRRVVLANLKQIKACYEKGLNKQPGLYGKIIIQWQIGPGGRVLEAGIKSTTLNSSEVENCAVGRLRTWKFPEPPVNEIAVVSYPFVFQAQE